MRHLVNDLLRSQFLVVSHPDDTSHRDPGLGLVWTATAHAGRAHNERAYVYQRSRYLVTSALNSLPEPRLRDLAGPSQSPVELLAQAAQAFQGCYLSHTAL